MGRRKSGEGPRVKVVRVGGGFNARVRIGGRAYWLGRCPDGKVTAQQTARAARIWNEHLSGVAAPADLPATTASPEPQAPAP